ncbi:unnamed protein product [Spirodela intermedia]|uniref:Endonuclease/exonuclease/phosphatase domain-containing protein n=1 Tax=Spirodela intermedia TaxID=51605 RepID=A0A7I8JXP3_SPIIN|nr:unnamed protein product [Spirodela intermedia]
MGSLKLRRLCSRLRGNRGRSPAGGGSAVVRTLGRTSAASPGGRPDAAAPTARIATFNAAMFSIAPAVPRSWKSSASSDAGEARGNLSHDRCPKSILKQQSFGKSKHRVSINLPHNEISLVREKKLNSSGSGGGGGGGGGGGVLLRTHSGKAPMSSAPGSPAAAGGGAGDGDQAFPRSERSILEVLREVDADILALQNVKAEEENGMSPLSDLAEGLGMRYVFAESWAPQYGNAVLSRWPIKRWKVQKISDDTDFRNVLKATVDVPRVGEVTVLCTHLDHLNESWRMKQINSILRSSEGPHILAGGLNALDQMDYSAERWNDIVKYYEEIGKPAPKVEVIKFLKEKSYVDAKDFAGECEAIVVLAKGQDVQGTCKYGTRVDYILSSPSSPFEFLPGSYSVFSSKGTSDHHIVKVDIRKSISFEDQGRRHRGSRQKVVKMDGKSPSRGIWAVDR